jgi:hypothetical protein
VVNYMMLMRPVLKGLFDSGKTERTTRAHNFSPAAGGKNLEVFSPTIGRQLLELD